MLQQEIEALRVVYEAASRRDWDTAFGNSPPDLELKTPDENPIAGTYRGRDAVQGFFTEFWAAFEEVAAEPQDFEELGDRILVSVKMRMRPKDSSAEVEMRMAHLWTMRDGRPARCDVFLEREQALEAVRMGEGR